MNRFVWAGVVVGFVLVTGWAPGAVFSGCSDASAAAALDGRHFVVADDENNMLRIYRSDRPGAPVGQVDLDAFLCVEPENPEADIEGAARVGERIYWITSHGRNKNGRERPNRYAFFATDILAGQGGAPTVKPVGRPYRRLAYDLMFDARLRVLGLEKTIRLGESLTKAEREALATKENGLNIEGLAAGPDGTLLIGLRNPVYRDPVRKKDMAIVLTLHNPDAMVMRGEAARLGVPILLDADGLGIRSIERLEIAAGPDQYLITAGTANGKILFAFYTWAGCAAALLPLRVAMPKDFAPEAVFQMPGDPAVWILSDDGTLEIPVASPDECLPGELLGNGHCPNKFLVDVDRRTFRATVSCLNEGFETDKTSSR